MVQAEYDISQVIRALNVQLRNPEVPAELETYLKYPTMKSAISARGYIKQSAARFADYLTMHHLHPLPYARPPSKRCHSPFTKSTIPSNEEIGCLDRE